MSPKNPLPMGVCRLLHLRVRRSGSSGAGRCNVFPLLSFREPIGRAFAFEPEELNDEQRAALEHTLVSRDLVMDVSGIAGAGKSHLLRQVEKAAIAVGKTIGILSPTDASVKDLRRAKFEASNISRIPAQARTGEIKAWGE